MRTLSLVLQYDGTDFQGFQRLSRGRSVQGELEKAWKALTGEAVKTVGAGRTDAGVHALGQVVSFRTEAGIPTGKVVAALNGRLPRDVRVRRVSEREDAFHARFSAVSRTYLYVVRRAGRPSVFADRYSLLVTGRLDIDAMRVAGEAVLGTHDFRSFGSPAPGRTALRRLERVVIRERGAWMVIEMTANAFLRGMARTLAAQFLGVGRGELTPDNVRERLEAQDRGAAGKAAPPNGLYLARVKYGNADSHSDLEDEG